MSANTINAAVVRVKLAISTTVVALLDRLGDVYVEAILQKAQSELLTDISELMVYILNSLIALCRWLH